MAAFVDTNIFLYAYSSINEGEIAKVATAKRLIDRLTAQETLVLSAQVLSEFIWVGGRKGRQPLTPAELLKIIDRLNTQTVISIDGSLVQLALERVQHSRISYWDALIVESAIRSSAATLYTEDMHHGTRYGSLELINPFAS